MVHQGQESQSLHLPSLQQSIETIGQSGGYVSPEEDLILGVREFFHDSWVLEEYRAALKHDEIYGSVSHMLDAATCLSTSDGATSSLTRDELTEAKYYFAGGSCRYMFQFCTDDMVNHLLRAISSVADILPYIRGTVGDLSGL